jgi:hypothetical protein
LDGVRPRSNASILRRVIVNGVPDMDVALDEEPPDEVRTITVNANVYYPLCGVAD